MLMLTTGGKRAIKRPTTLAHFSFLVPEREILVKIKASVETGQYSILVNFDDQKWRRDEYVRRDEYDLQTF